MDFKVDKQTLEDLNLLGKYKNNSVFSIFCRTRTRGGEQLLEGMFRQPLTVAGEINRRSGVFKNFVEQKYTFPFDDGLVTTVENYLGTSGPVNGVSAVWNICRWKFFYSFAGGQEYESVVSGLSAVVRFLNLLRDFYAQPGIKASLSGHGEEVEEVWQILKDQRLQWVFQGEEALRFSWLRMAKRDYGLRTLFCEKLRRLLEIVFQLDVFISVAEVARARGFAFAEALPEGKGKNELRLRGLFHPQLAGAVTNDIGADTEKNVIFLTGANMAGKSTLMKSFGIAVYLAHMGFPVAAEKMEFTVRDGLYTSINVPDNLNQGYSHFYAEVLRVKNVAEEVGRGKNLVVIFDELFKGTNVKDAYDATVAVVEAFARYRNCIFMVSTHITEAGHTLQECCAHFCFVCLPTCMEGNVPSYTYRLQEGISNDRHGMRIINHEHILEIIRGETSQPLS